MTTERLIIPGVVKNGVVVPQTTLPLPEGLHVEISLPAVVSAELQAELAAWDQLSDEAWRMIEGWEQEGSS